MTGLLIVAALLWSVRAIARAGRDRHAMSSAWLTAQATADSKTGWEGPRWRFPAELKAQARVDRRRAMRVVGRDEMRRAR